MARTDDDALKALRQRAYELADTGRFPTWEAVKRKLQAEEYQMPGIEVRGAKLFRELVTARCRRARLNAHPFPALASLHPSS